MDLQLAVGREFAALFIQVRGQRQGTRMLPVAALSHRLYAPKPTLNQLLPILMLAAGVAVPGHCLPHNGPRRLRQPVQRSHPRQAEGDIDYAGGRCRCRRYT